MNRITTATLVIAFTFGGLTTSLAEDLGTALRESGWDRIIGTWVDPETKGTQHKVTYRWRYKDKVVEIVHRGREKETTALMGRNPNSGAVVHVAANNEGGSSIGKWTVENGEAVLRLRFVTGTGEEGELEIRQKFEDADTMLVTVVLPEPITFKLVRMKKK